MRPSVFDELAASAQAAETMQPKDERERAALEAIDRGRLTDTAIRLVAQHSPTCSTAAAADELASILSDDGFAVERPTADWPDSPAVVTRFSASADGGPRSGRVLQFDGHLDTVEQLPFVPPAVTDGVLTGSGASDMKGGLAAAVEVMRALRDSRTLQRGEVLLTAHDHHEAPSGDGRQVLALMRDGIVGDAALIPEYLGDQLPLSGRGMAVFRLHITRSGGAVHEVFREERPDVLLALADAAGRLKQLEQELSDAAGGVERATRDTVFVGQMHAGEMYNQASSEATLEGTRRWMTPGDQDAAIASLERIADVVGADHGVEAAVQVQMRMEAFQISDAHELVGLLRAAYADVTGRGLPTGVKPFGDDGNRLAHAAGIPVLTHGPVATGAHTVEERAPIDELVRVAQVYTLMALRFC